MSVSSSRMAMFAFCVMLAIVPNPTQSQASPSIVADGQDIEVTIPSGANLFIKRGGAQREAVVASSELSTARSALESSMNAMSTMQQSMSTTVSSMSTQVSTQVQQSLSSILALVSQQVVAQNSSIDTLSTYVAQNVQSTISAVSSTVQSQGSTSAIDSLTNQVAALAADIGKVATSYPNNFPSGFDFYYNNDVMSNASAYVALAASENGNYTCNGEEVATSCSGPRYTQIGNGFIHPGRSRIQTGRPFDSYAIISYNVSEDAVYSITDSIYRSLVPGASDGYQIVTFAEMADGQMVKTFNREVFPQPNSWTLPPTTEFEFDHLVGYLTAGSRIHVGFGPNGAAFSDSSTSAFTISQGLKPTLKALPGVGVPLNNGFNPQMTEQHWQGTTTSGAWQTIVEANGADPVLENGAYVMFLDHFSTFRNGGGSYGEQATTSPFSWDNTITNSAAAAVIPSHMAGHANNNEVLQFRTVRAWAGGSGTLKLQFSTNRDWTTAVKLRFRFLRLF